MFEEACLHACTLDQYQRALVVLLRGDPHAPKVDKVVGDGRGDRSGWQSLRYGRYRCRTDVSTWGGEGVGVEDIDTQLERVGGGVGGEDADAECDGEGLAGVIETHAKPWKTAVLQ